ncbi:hypothetical protein TNCV_4434681 [Trichonephila clavipes]|nr:hypothetical protein TNCV_4434681 [Trichonephila clavipes]
MSSIPCPLKAHRVEELIHKRDVDFWKIYMWCWSLFPSHTTNSSAHECGHSQSWEPASRQTLDEPEDRRRHIEDDEKPDDITSCVLRR